MKRLLHLWNELFNDKSEEKWRIKLAEYAKASSYAIHR